MLVAEFFGFQRLVSGGDVALSHRPILGFFLGVSLAGHLLVLFFEHLLTPSPTRHHELATETFIRGPYANLFWGGAIVAGGLLPLAVLITVGIALSPMLAIVVSMLALAGGAAWSTSGWRPASPYRCPSRPLENARPAWPAFSAACCLTPAIFLCTTELYQ